MAGFEIPNSVRTYVTDRKVREAVDALADVLQGDNPPEMSFEDARHYNQALLMAAQVRADHNDLLFWLWEQTFGPSADKVAKQFVLDFESDRCTPESMWDEGIVWQTISREGCYAPDLVQAFELYACVEDREVYLLVARWDGAEGEHGDFSFDPADIGDATTWQSFRDDEGHIVAQTASVSLDDISSNPDECVRGIRAAADQMVAYLMTKL